MFKVCKEYRAKDGTRAIIDSISSHASYVLRGRYYDESNQKWRNTSWTREGKLFSFKDNSLDLIDPDLVTESAILPRLTATEILRRQEASHVLPPLIVPIIGREYRTKDGGYAVIYRTDGHKFRPYVGAYRTSIREYWDACTWIKDGTYGIGFSARGKDIIFPEVNKIFYVNLEQSPTDPSIFIAKDQSKNWPDADRASPGKKYAVRAVRVSGKEIVKENDGELGYC